MANATGVGIAVFGSNKVAHLNKKYLVPQSLNSIIVIAQKVRYEK